MNFYTGLALGLIIGANVGFLFAAFCRMAKTNDAVADRAAKLRKFHVVPR